MGDPQNPCAIAPTDEASSHEFSVVQGRQNLRPIESDRYYLEGVGYLIGDISCKFNARSGYMRCAVNPDAHVMVAVTMNLKDYLVAKKGFKSAYLGFN